MAKERVVALDGANFVSIRATIPAHYMKIYEDGTRALAFTYKLPGDGFVQEYTTTAGDPIELIGHGRSGILGRPPNYCGVGHPTLGDVVLMIRDAAEASTNDIIVYESESEL